MWYWNNFLDKQEDQSSIDWVRNFKSVILISILVVFASQQAATYSVKQAVLCYMSFFMIDSQSESACRIFVERNSRTSAYLIEPGLAHARLLRQGSAVEIMQC